MHNLEPANIRCEELLNINGRQFDGFGVIPNCDQNAGLSALMTYALNGVRNSLKLNLLPIVNFDRLTTANFYSSSHGENIWNYFWEPVMEYSYDDLKDFVNRRVVSNKLITTFTPEQISYWHQHDPERIGTYWGKDDVEDPFTWMKEKRLLGQKYVEKYIKVNPGIIEKVNQLFRLNLESIFTIGVHIRGTDFAYSSPTLPEKYFEEIERVVSKKNPSDYKIFLATDQVQFVKLFQTKFKDKVIAYDSARSESDVAAFKLKDVNPYKKGEDVLIDILALSKCDHILKSASAVGEYALWFNPCAKFTDFSLECKSETRNQLLSNSAFRKMNLDQKIPIIRFFLRIHKVFDNFIDIYVFQFDPRARTSLIIGIKYIVNSPIYMLIRLTKKIQKKIKPIKHL